MQSNKTATYISELLYRYECVILPGFGAFLTRRQSASIVEETNAFYPPKKIISFNNQLVNNDGLLANYIASAEHISYTDAIAKIQRFVLSLNEKLAKGERIDFDKIGAFFTSVENTLQFEPYDTENYLTEAFGLTSFVSPKVERNIEIQREVYKEEVTALEEKTPITFTPERKKERPYLQYAAAVAVLVGIGGFFSLKQVSDTNVVYNHNELKEANLEIENRIQEATFEIANPLPTINLSLVKDNNQNPSLIENENLNTEEFTTESNAKRYHAVAGAFRILANANKKVVQLKAQGYDAKVIGTNQYGLHQVVYDSYQTKLEARKALQQIKKENPASWLLVK